jgi:hypothetical protein
MIRPFSSSLPATIRSPSHPEENVEAEINRATLDYSKTMTDKLGRVVTMS